MTPSEEALKSVRDELRDVLDDPRAWIVKTYEVWTLPKGGTHVKDAVFANQFHHQVQTIDGLVYACSTVRGEGLELDTLNAPMSTPARRIGEAATALKSDTVRLLSIPSSDVLALWDPADQLLIMVGAAATDPLSMWRQHVLDRMLVGQHP